jgi:4-hydroxybenzoate polyprenyltransferase
LKLDDGKPWFRRWLVIGFKPITSEGKKLIELLAGSAFGTGFLAMYLAEDQPHWAVILTTLFFVVVLAGYVIIYLKMEDPF